MNKTRVELTLASAALGLAVLVMGVPAAASAAPRPAGQCFYARQVSGFSAPDREHVYLRVGVRDVYALDLLGPCPDVDWTLGLGIASHGSNFICSGLDAELIVPRSPSAPLGGQRCPVEHIRKLTAAEVAAIPRKLRP